MGVGISRTSSFVSLLCMLGVFAGSPSSQARTFYIANNGSDTNDGCAPDSAWQSLGRVNAALFEAGDRVLFRRGDTWRGQLKPRSGNESGTVTYGAYGDGAKPLLLGSVKRNRPEDWRREAENIWATTEPQALPGAAAFHADRPSLVECDRGLARDIGNMIFNAEAACGVKVWKEQDLRQQGQFWYDEERHALKMYSERCPAEYYSDIECALMDDIIDESNAGYVIYENLALKYGAAHGIGGDNTHHIIVRDCDLAFIGGGDQMGGGKTVRYGNGIEFWGAAHDNLVERCRLWEIYDAALTNQSGGPATPQYNLIYRFNVIWNCEYSFEYWNRPENSVTHHVYFENNTCVNAGHGWGHTQRPDPSGRHLCFYSSPAPAHDVFIRNNIFYEAKGNAFYAPAWPRQAIDSLEIDHNCWYQASGDMILLKGAAYAMSRFAAYQTERGKDTHSMAAVPGFADAARDDFHLSVDSPCVDAGTDRGYSRDFDGTTVPQGRAPDIGALERKQ